MTLTFQNRATIFLAAFAIAIVSQAEPYNEVVDEHGQLRKPYADFVENHYDAKKHGPERSQILFPTPLGANSFLDRPLDDSIALLPTPVVLSEADYQLIQHSSAQRAKALAEFFNDVVLHNSERISKSGIISDSQIESIFNADNDSRNLRWLRRVYGSNAHNGKINFWHGSDNVRDENGEFKIIEDNTGQLGGTGDIEATHTAFAKQLGLTLPKLKYPIEEAIERFLADIPKEHWADQVIAVVSSTDFDFSDLKLDDNEDYRQYLALKNLGLNVTTMSHLAEKSIDEIDKLRKVVSLYDIVTSRDKHNEIPLTLLGHFTTGQLEFMVSPGVDQISNKALLPYMDALIRFYLNEEPALKTAPTRIISLIDSLSDNCFSNDSKVVIKKTNACQGSAVYIPHFMTEQQKAHLNKTHIKNWMAWGAFNHYEDIPFFVSQDYIDQSYVPTTASGQSWVRFNVDFRPLNYVFHNEPNVKPLIWGRANFKFPNYLTNVSRGAMESVVTTPHLCSHLLK